MHKGLIYWNFLPKNYYHGRPQFRTFTISDKKKDQNQIKQDIKAEIADAKSNNRPVDFSHIDMGQNRLQGWILKIR